MLQRFFLNRFRHYFRLFSYFIILTFFSCREQAQKNNAEQNKAAILKTEQEFAALLQQEGIAKAFYTYAAEDAVLNANDSLFKGKNAIKDHYENWPYQNVKLQWKPDFVEVAASGDLGYTYGKYTFSATDSTGKPINSRGIFHTVWKKQQDGNWRFVWD